MADQTTPSNRKVINDDSILASINAFADVDSGNGGDLSDEDDMSLASTLSFNENDIKYGPYSSELTVTGPRDPSITPARTSYDNSEFEDIIEEKEKNNENDSNNENDNKDITMKPSELDGEQSAEVAASDKEDALYDPNVDKIKLKYTVFFCNIFYIKQLCLLKINLAFAQNPLLMPKTVA